MFESEKKEIRKILEHYRSGSHVLRRDFFEPCFNHCSYYHRSAGYFASTALISWISGLRRLVQEDAQLEIKLIVSHELSTEDIEALRSCQDPLERRRILSLAVEKVVDMIIALQDQDHLAAERVALFGWLVVQGYVKLKFAFPKHLDDPGIYHEKFGVFEFPWGDRIAFTGSANETGSGHTRNFESIDVYRSWVEGDANRVTTKMQQFEDTWDGLAEGLEIIPLSQESLRRLRAVARSPRAGGQEGLSLEDQSPENIWIHQDEAVEIFLAANRGILEMATGTGKTRTALRILRTLIGQKQIQGAIITTDGTDLLGQWCRELEVWVESLSTPFVVARHFGPFHDLQRFIVNPLGSFLVISRQALPDLMKRLPIGIRSNLAIVHDEVHGLGMPGIRTGLTGEHASFPYVLGLSATPDRAYDDDGNAFIEQEIGPSIFRFPLEAAIAKGILCEFDYVPLEYQLTENDRQRLKQVYNRQAARAHSGTPMSPEEVWIEISKVYKTAEMKPSIFAEFLRQHPESLMRSIIFVETREYAEEILQILHRYTNRYRTYYADDEAQNLVQFSKGEIDCLITCHRISQGIDIKSLRTVFLFASARAKLETVQRIGRCLRTDPNDPAKRALVVDFVRSQDQIKDQMDADQERHAWLAHISKTKKGDEVVYQ